MTDTVVLDRLTTSHSKVVKVVKVVKGGQGWSKVVKGCQRWSRVVNHE